MAWNKLADSTTLRPSDTEESVSNIESEYQRQREIRETVEAKEAVQSTESVARSAQNVHHRRR